MTLEEIQGLKNRVSAQTKGWYDQHRQTVAAFMKGDHWQAGMGWVGPAPAPSSKKYSEVMAMIANVFVSTNKIAEVVGRHANSVIGFEPDWSLEEPSREKSDLGKKADAALTEWWDKREALSTLQQAAIYLLTQRRGVLRLYIPKAAMELKGERYIVPKEAFEKVLERIYLSAPDPQKAGYLYDDDDVVEGAYVEFRRSDRDQMEWQFVNDKGQTTIVVEGDPDPSGQFPQAEYPLGGHLMLYQMEREEFVSPNMVSQQKALNKYLTMGSRNLDTAGFLQTTILNGQMPGRWIKDANAPGGERFVPDDTAKAGAGVREYIAPFVVENADGKGNLGMIPASIDHREPVDTNRLQPTKDDLLESFYAEANQLHVLLNRDSQSTGEARIQATNEYRNSLAKTTVKLEAAMRWLLKTLVLLGVHFSGEQEYAKLVPNVRCNVFVTEPSAEEIKSDLEMVRAGTMSRETQMGRSRRIIDPDAEKGRILTERGEYLDNPNERRNALAAAVTAGVYSQRQALIEDGKSDADADRIVAERIKELEQQTTGA